MQLPHEARRLRIYIGEDDNHHGKPLSVWLVEQARILGLAGATVLRGILGFGANSRIKTSSILMLSEDLPLVVEIIDSPSKIESFMSVVDTVITEGLVTI